MFSILGYTVTTLLDDQQQLIQNDCGPAASLRWHTPEARLVKSTELGLVQRGLLRPFKLSMLAHTSKNFLCSAGGHINPAMMFGPFLAMKVSLIRPMMNLVAQRSDIDKWYSEGNVLTKEEMKPF
uniref:Uncharacterized protein n=1 Tax=Salix viminalis TaxID=40686 RepID=A0A6N2NBV3_SALVM